MKFTFLSTILVSAMLFGCATNSGDLTVVPIGPDKYMINSGVHSSNYASSSLKTKLFKDAGQYCSSLTRVMLPIDAAALNEKIGDSNQVALQFYCLLDSDPRLK